jgi:hypothetical protein
VCSIGKGKDNKGYPGMINDDDEDEEIEDSTRKSK